jgi:ketosteroid isomerase-like protein
MLLGAERPALRYEPLASLGDSLALFHESISASAVKGGELDVGGYEHASVQLLEADAAGRMLRSEAFTVDRLGEAIVRLYERYAELLPEGPTRARAAARARSFATQLVRLASERYANTLAPDVECVDHRVLGTWSARGAEAVMRNLGSLPVLAHGISMCIDDVLRLEHDALLVRGQARGTDRVGGGVFETTPMLAVVIAGDDGRLTRIEVFDVDRKADALARFDELSAHRAPRIQNAASRATEGFRAAFEARDWAGVAALIASGFRQSDRRKTAQIEMDREGYLAGLRFLFDVAAPAYTCELLATRGDRLALSRAVLRGAGAEVGPFESELLALVEVDEEGRQLGRVTFDAGDLDAAYAELDARYVAGEAAPFPAVAAGGRAFVAAATARDWDALSALLAPDLVVDDHRPLGWGTLHGPVSLVDSWKALVELAPDVHVRVDHAMVTHSVSLAVFTLLGTREGGAFEDERVVVHQYDGNGRICRHEIYSLDQLDEARARFASRAANACRASLAALVPPNAATAAYDREQAAFEARDWAALRAVFAPLARIDDRRSLVGIPVDPDQLVTDKMRFAEAEDARYERRLVATFGDRIDLERGVASGGPAGGRFEIEVLTMTEVDEAGQIVLRVTFDAGAGRAARREAAARLVAGDPVAASLSPILELIEASNDHDLTRMRAVLADDFVNEDHRRTGVGRIEGVDAYLESIAATRGLVRDAQIEILSVRAIERHGVVGTMRSFGTLGDGGEFEAVWAVVSIVAGGRITRSEIFEIDQLDPALARFEELCAGCEAQEARGRDTPST